MKIKMADFLSKHWISFVLFVCLYVCACVCVSQKHDSFLFCPKSYLFNLIFFCSVVCCCFIFKFFERIKSQHFTWRKWKTREETKAKWCSPKRLKTKQRLNDSRDTVQNKCTAKHRHRHRHRNRIKRRNIDEKSIQRLQCQKNGTWNLKPSHLNKKQNESNSNMNKISKTVALN